MGQNKVRIAVVGAGRIAQVAHMPALRQNPNVELVAVVDEDPVKARSTKEQFGFESYYEDFAQMLTDAEVDAVDICTPNYLHAPMAIAALRSGRDVLCEKPLARSLAEAQKMVDTADTHNQLLMVAMNNRFRGDVQTLRTFVKGKELGDVQMVKVGWLRRSLDWKEREWLTHREKSGGGALLDLGTPLMDLAIWIGGLRKPTSVTCGVFGRRGKNGVEDSACAMIRFAGGACMMLEVAWNVTEPRDVTYLQVYGSRGAGTLNPLEIHKAMQGVLVNVTPAHGKSARSSYKGSYRAEIDHFVDCVKNKRKPLTSGKDALAVLRILDALYKSADSGREVALD